MSGLFSAIIIYRSSYMERVVDSIGSTHAVGGASLGALLLGIRHMHAFVLPGCTNVAKVSILLYAFLSVLI